jgi:hypothetical protein
MSGDLFGRRYRVIVAEKGTSGIDVTGLRCVFTVEKSMSAEPNRSVIQIYNLSAATQNKILSTGKRIIIEAGYEDSPQFGLIFDGDVIKALKRGVQGVDKITELIAQDGDLFLNSGFISVSYSAGQTTRSVLSQMAGVGDEEIVLGSVSDGLKNTKLARGKAMFGQPKDYARMLAKTEGALFYVNDRQINLVKPADLPQGEIVDLSPASGLIGTPEQTETGVNAKCLLNPLLNVNKLVHIKNDDVQQSRDTAGTGLSTGVYRIIKLKHTGDTLGNDWYTEFEGIAQPGAVPLTGASYNN